MYEECPAVLQLTRTILEDGEKDEVIHHCKIIRYNPEEENIYLIAGKSDITSFSLVDKRERECYFIPRVFNSTLFL